MSSSGVSVSPCFHKSQARASSFGQSSRAAQTTTVNAAVIWALAIALREVADESLVSHLLTVAWLRPHRRAIDLADCPLRASRSYRHTSSAVTRRYEGVLRSREVGLRGMPRSFRGLRPRTRLPPPRGLPREHPATRPATRGMSANDGRGRKEQPPLIGVRSGEILLLVYRGGVDGTRTRGLRRDRPAF